MALFGAIFEMLADRRVHFIEGVTIIDTSYGATKQNLRKTID